MLWLRSWGNWNLWLVRSTEGDSSPGEDYRLWYQGKKEGRYILRTPRQELWEAAMALDNNAWWLELLHRRADSLRISPHSMLSYHMTPSCDFLSASLDYSGTSSVPIFSEVQCWQQVSWDVPVRKCFRIALTQHPQECTRAYVEDVLSWQRPARLCRSHAPRDSARPPARASGTDPFRKSVET